MDGVTAEQPAEEETLDPSMAQTVEMEAIVDAAPAEETPAPAEQPEPEPEAVTEEVKEVGVISFGTGEDEEFGEDSFGTGLDETPFSYNEQPGYCLLYTSRCV